MFEPQPGSDPLTYIVVENSGMVGERDVRSFTNLRAAATWMDDWYTEGERDRSSPDCLYPDICSQDRSGTRLYEIY